MNYLNEIRENYPILFKTIKNAITNKRMPHGFLLYGNHKTDVMTPSLGLVQALISKTECLQDEKIAPRNWKTYSDLHIINVYGTDNISKSDIINKIGILKMTPLQDGGCKILLVNSIEDASMSSLNSILKFLESPTPNTFFIFNTNSFEKIPSVIKSRMLSIKIKSTPKNLMRSKLFDLGISDDISNVLIEISNNYDDLKRMIDDNIKEIYENVINIISESTIESSKFYTSMHKLIIKKNDIYILNILMIFFKDIISKKENIPIINTECEDVINKYININFHGESAIELIDEYLINKKYNSNFSIAKGNFLVKMMGLYE